MDSERVISVVVFFDGCSICVDHVSNKVSDELPLSFGAAYEKAISFAVEFKMELYRLLLCYQQH